MNKRIKYYQSDQVDYFYKFVKIDYDKTHIFIIVPIYYFLPCLWSLYPPTHPPCRTSAFPLQLLSLHVTTLLTNSRPPGLPVTPRSSTGLDTQDPLLFNPRLVFSTWTTAPHQAPYCQAALGWYALWPPSSTLHLCLLPSSMRGWCWGRVCVRSE